MLTCVILISLRSQDLGQTHNKNSIRIYPSSCTTRKVPCSTNIYLLQPMQPLTLPLCADEDVNCTQFTPKTLQYETSHLIVLGLQELLRAQNRLEDDLPCLGCHSKPTTTTSRRFLTRPIILYDFVRTSFRVQQQAFGKGSSISSKVTVL